MQGLRFEGVRMVEGLLELELVLSNLIVTYSSNIIYSKILIWKYSNSNRTVIEWRQIGIGAQCKYYL